MFDQPVVNKPWEWIENLGEPPLDSTEEGRERERDHVTHLVKNSGSISLEYFAARQTGDTIEVDMTSEGYEKSERFRFEDGLSENIFIRDWKDTRFEPERELSPDTLARLKREPDPTVPVMATGGDYKKDASVLSISVTQHQIQQSPITQSKASNITIIDVDSISETSAFKGQQDGKRKATSVRSDDEVEIIEGPTHATTSAKKHKAGKAPMAKTRAKKKY